MQFCGNLRTRCTDLIDADGVLEDQHVGDGSIEGKLKKMIARAVEIENAKPAPPAASQAEASGN